MALLDDIRTAVRVSPVPVADASGLEPDAEGWEPTYTSDFDGELQDLAMAAIADLTRVGVKPDLLDPESLAPLAKMAVKLYAKANFGYDNPERKEFLACYDRTVVDLLNSTANIACWRTSMRDCVVADIADQEYTGHTVRPQVSVSFDGAELEPGTDFLVTYSRNVEVGTATAYVEGTGAFAGTVAAEFEIVGA